MRSRRTPIRRIRPTTNVSGPRTGLLYNARFVSDADAAEIVAWLATLHPIWEQRYSSRNPPPEGQQNRRLLRPVYWLGNWQFACLDYYRPPQGLLDRCVDAEPYPPALQRIVTRMEALARSMFRGVDMPERWHLNTCLVNFYGDREEFGRPIDAARVGEHRDFEPGPIASISLGERALFEFVKGNSRGEPSELVLRQWLEDRSLLLFGGDLWKNRTFHRVVRVEKKLKRVYPPDVTGFKTRRVNFTFRYVPDEHVVPYAKLSAEARNDVRGYMQQLAKHSEFFGRAIEGENTAVAPTSRL